ncbi:formyltetrahydrofolate deformylase [Achromobacter sp. AONIH1]|uniref:formyltetrahydrofolate deformylase n=1 Tax=unclassified Achromobacter TaxID=2626865 RepID=UPI000CD189A2|nr:formyltetrahydrofolate deformylase [Achromobacter sp. AONIH1]AUT47252.1 formyltetrahydrofolate deformylase [Achromobacter sp. AONIH1]
MHAQDAHTPTPHPFCLTLTCPSEPGQVAAVVGFLDRRGGYVDELAVFDDKSKQRFFLRCIFHGVAAQPLELDALKRDFADIAARFDMSWQVYDLTRRPKVIIMVSRLDHCLADLLFRWRMDELRMDIAAIVSNHPDLLPLAREHAIAFHHLPVTPQTKPEQEARLLRLVEDSGADLVVLARYMQVLSPDATARLAGRAINIHHSFLPGFKGARPYHQAFERGVKLIGATAHFVTGDLDEGPIIEQMVDRVDHSYDPAQLLAAGRDMECVALARAVRLYLERRVFINDNRTVVL